MNRGFFRKTYCRNNLALLVLNVPGSISSHDALWRLLRGSLAQYQKQLNQNHHFWDARNKRIVIIERGGKL